MKKQLTFILGLLFLVLAIIGMILPLLPSTPFALLATYLFSKSSPRFHRWCLNLPILGEGIKDWQINRVIRWKAKLSALLVISISLYFLLSGNAPLVLKIIVSIILTSVLIFIFTRATRPQNSRADKIDLTSGINQ